MSGASDVARLRVICGPTAAGKSSIALALAGKYNAAIISADSRQVYRGFDIGTAKPSAAEQARVPHYCVDVAEPTQRYSAALWAAHAGSAIGSVRAAGRTPVIVGGTGFYLRALFRPLFSEPPLDPTRRSALQQWFETMSTEALRRWCVALDPARAPLGRTQLLRALEVALLSGERMSDLHARSGHNPASRTGTARYLVLDAGASLREIIHRRVRAMLDAGWDAEVARLMSSVPATAPAWNASGYETVRRLVCGEIDRESAIDRIFTETRQYAKRQRTWFRTQLAGEDVTRLDTSHPDVWARVEEWWQSETGN